MIRADAYAAHRAFLAPVRSDLALWRLTAGIAVTLVAYSLMPVILGGPDGAIGDGDRAGGLILQLLSYALALLPVLWWLRAGHGRDWPTLFGPAVAATRQFGRVAIAVGLALLVLSIMPPWPSLADLAAEPAPLPWLLVLPFGAAAILVQSASEEVLFRGYLQQELAARFRSPLVWMWGPSLLFGLLHGVNGDGATETAIWVIWASSLGLAAADLTARAGTLGPAIGLHWMNNLYAFVLFGEAGRGDSGLALFVFPPFERSGGDQSLGQLLEPGGILELSTVLIFNLILWTAARIALRR